MIDPSRQDFIKIRERVEKGIATVEDTKLLLEMVLDYRKRLHKQACDQNWKRGLIEHQLNSLLSIFSNVRDAIDPSGHWCQYSQKDIASAILNPEHIAHIRLRVADAWEDSLRYQPTWAKEHYNNWKLSIKQMWKKILGR